MDAVILLKHVQTYNEKYKTETEFMQFRCTPPLALRQPTSKYTSIFYLIMKAKDKRKRINGFLKETRNIYTINTKEPKDTI